MLHKIKKCIPLRMQIVVKRAPLPHMTSAVVLDKLEQSENKWYSPVAAVAALLFQICHGILCPHSEVLELTNPSNVDVIFMSARLPAARKLMLVIMILNETSNMQNLPNPPMLSALSGPKFWKGWKLEIVKFALKSVVFHQSLLFILLVPSHVLEYPIRPSTELSAN